MVFSTLARAISTEAYDDLMSQLPSDYRPLLPKATYHEPPSHQALLDWVSAQAKLDPDGAQRALDAVLETLAERIAPGEVDDLIARLPVELHPALKRGKAGNPGRARHTPLDEFLALVARRECDTRAGVRPCQRGDGHIARCARGRVLRRERSAATGVRRAVDAAVGLRNPGMRRQVDHRILSV